jgi:hypothetical protein
MPEAPTTPPDSSGNHEDPRHGITDAEIDEIIAQMDTQDRARQTNTPPAENVATVSNEERDALLAPHDAAPVAQPGEPRVEQVSAGQIFEPVVVTDAEASEPGTFDQPERGAERPMTDDDEELDAALDTERLAQGSDADQLAQIRERLDRAEADVDSLRQDEQETDRQTGDSITERIRRYRQEHPLPEYIDHEDDAPKKSWLSWLGVLNIFGGGLKERVKKLGRNFMVRKSEVLNPAVDTPEAPLIANETLSSGTAPDEIERVPQTEPLTAATEAQEYTPNSFFRLRKSIFEGASIDYRTDALLTNYQDASYVAQSREEDLNRSKKEYKDEIALIHRQIKRILIHNISRYMRNPEDRIAATKELNSLQGEKLAETALNDDDLAAYRRLNHAKGLIDAQLRTLRKGTRKIVLNSADAIGSAAVSTGKTLGRAASNARKALGRIKGGGADLPPENTEEPADEPRAHAEAEPTIEDPAETEPAVVEAPKMPLRIPRDGRISVETAEELLGNPAFMAFLVEGKKQNPDVTYKTDKLENVANRKRLAKAFEAFEAIDSVAQNFIGALTEDIQTPLKAATPEGFDTAWEGVDAAQKESITNYLKELAYSNPEKLLEYKKSATEYSGLRKKIAGGEAEIKKLEKQFTQKPEAPNRERTREARELTTLSHNLAIVQALWSPKRAVRWLRMSKATPEQKAAYEVIERKIGAKLSTTKLKNLSEEIDRKLQQANTAAPVISQPAPNPEAITESIRTTEDQVADFKQRLMGVRRSFLTDDFKPFKTIHDELVAEVSNYFLNPQKKGKNNAPAALTFEDTVKLYTHYTDLQERIHQDETDPNAFKELPIDFKIENTKLRETIQNIVAAEAKRIITENSAKIQKPAELRTALKGFIELSTIAGRKGSVVTAMKRDMLQSIKADFKGTGMEILIDRIIESDLQ